MSVTSPLLAACSLTYLQGQLCNVLGFRLNHLYFWLYLQRVSPFTEKGSLTNRLIIGFNIRELSILHLTQTTKCVKMTYMYKITHFKQPPSQTPSAKRLSSQWNSIMEHIIATFCYAIAEQFLFCHQHFRQIDSQPFSEIMYNWARSCKNVSYAICEQQRCR